MTDVLPGWEDFAIVIGISEYGEFPSIAGVAADARLFAEWVVAGGGLPRDHVTVLVSEDAFIRRSEIDSAFETLVPSQAHRVGRRLYIYMAGHGYGVGLDEVALLTSDASPSRSGAVSPKAYGDFFRAAGLFDEVVLFADCSGVGESTRMAPLSTPPFDSTIMNATPASYMYVLAAERGEPAYTPVHEDPLAGAHGNLTSAVLIGLSGAAADASGSITSQTLASYVVSRLSETEGGRLQLPRVAFDAARPIVFRAGSTTQQTTQAPTQNAQPEIPTDADRRPTAPTPGNSYPTPRIASDRWSADDWLGYGAFARTVATLITHEETVPPLTIGIKAPWGAGKTSLMKRVQYMLDGDAAVTEENESARRNRDFNVVMTLKQLLAVLTTSREPDAAPVPPKSERPSHNNERYLFLLASLQRLARAASRVAKNPNIGFEAPTRSPSAEGALTAIPARVTVWFNAWKYQTSEQIWAGLAHCIISQVTARMSVASRELFWLNLHASRVDVNKVRWTVRRIVIRDLIPIVSAALVALIASALLISVSPIAAMSGMGLAALSGMIGSWHKWNRKLGEKVGAELSNIIREPDYQGKLGFLHLVESDIRDVLDLVATPDAPLVVFVDDLDRCAPHKVAEVVEAINLFLSGDYPNCIFVLGMEPAIVAAALEVANKELLDKAAAFGAGDGQVPLGWRFMEKIIQLPLAIPSPDDDGIKSYLSQLTRARDAPSVAPTPQADDVASFVAQFQGVEDIDGVISHTDVLLANAPADARPAIAEASKRVYTQKFTDRDPAIARFIAENTALLQGNPRQMKRYVNLFRFASTLRHTLIMDRAGDGRKARVMPTDEALTKFITLSVRWPHAADHLRLTGEPQGEAKEQPRPGALLARLETCARELEYGEPEERDAKWVEELNAVGLQHAKWAHDREFRWFLASGESLAAYEGCGVW